MDLKGLMNVRNEEMRKIYDMAHIGNFGSDNLELYINSREGDNVPHFHVLDHTSKGEEIETCVQIRENRYFHHGRHQGTLNAKQRDALMAFMQSKPKTNKPQFNKFDTYYELIAYLWELFYPNSDTEIKYDKDGNVIIPDYTNILPYKENK